MAKAARERLARLLGDEEAGAFSGQVSLPADVASPIESARSVHRDRVLG